MEGKQIPKVRKHNHNIRVTHTFKMLLTTVMIVKARVKLVFGWKLKVIHNSTYLGLTPLFTPKLLLRVAHIHQGMITDLTIIFIVQILTCHWRLVATHFRSFLLCSQRLSSHVQTSPAAPCSVYVVTINTAPYHAILDEYTMILNEHCSMSEATLSTCSGQWQYKIRCVVVLIP